MDKPFSKTADDVVAGIAPEEAVDILVRGMLSFVPASRSADVSAR